MTSPIKYVEITDKLTDSLMLLRFFKKFSYIVFLFIYIYGPPFHAFPFSSDKLVHFAFLISLFLYPHRYQQLIRYPIVSLTMLIQSLTIVYTLVLYLFTPTSYNYIVQNLLLLTEVIISGLFFVALYLEWFRSDEEKEFDFFLFAIIVIGTVQSVISTVGVVNPQFNRFVNNELLFYEKSYNFGIQYRGFGMSDDYFFTMPVVQGFAMVFCLFYVFKEKYLYLIPVPFLLLSISFNARIGFTPVVVFTVLSLVFLVKRSEFKLRAVLLFIGAVVLFTLYFDPNLFWKSKFDQGVSFGYSFFDVTLKYFFSNQMDDSDNYAVLKEMAFLPERNDLVFGTGENIFYSNHKNSDIGYVNQLFYGGIIYLFLQFSVVFVAFYQSFKVSKRLREHTQARFVLVVALITFILSNVKGYFFLVKPGLRMVFLLFFLIYFISVFKKQTDVQSA